MLKHAVKTWYEHRGISNLPATEGEVDAMRAALQSIAPTVKGEAVVTKDEIDNILAITRQDKDGKILEILAEAPEYKPSTNGSLCNNYECRLPEGCSGLFEDEQACMLRKSAL